MDLISKEPLQLQPAQTREDRAEATRFYRDRLGVWPPAATLWTVQLSHRLVLVAPVQRENGTPLLWPTALVAADGELNDTSRGYLRLALIGLRLGPPHPEHEPAPGPGPSELALALALPGSEDERSLQGAGFQPFPTFPRRLGVGTAALGDGHNA